MIIRLLLMLECVWYFIIQLISDSPHVVVEFLSPRANIYESTHVHYDGTLSNCHYINKRESSRTHVRVEFLSPHANIYESKHAHYDRTISTCILLINQTRIKSHTCGGGMYVHSCEHLREKACALWWKDIYLHLFINESHVAFLSPHAHWNTLSKNVPKTFSYKVANLWE